MRPPSTFFRLRSLPPASGAAARRYAICHEPEKKKLEQLKRQQKYIRVVMVRHGESEWNAKNLFTGWYDTELSAKGIMEAEQAGATLRRMHLCFDNAFTSVLTRAMDTLQIILAAINQRGIPVFRSWRLNERHYGALTGLNKQETAEKFGEDKVKLWRRSYSVPPPKMTPDHPYYKNIVLDTRYEKDPPRNQFPMFESLKLTLERTLPYWDKVIIPQIAKGRRVIVVAHGNSLRGIVKKLEQLSDDEIVDVNIPTGIPFQYLLDPQNMKPITKQRRYLGDPEVVRKATAKVAAQASVKKD